MGFLNDVEIVEQIQDAGDNIIINGQAVPKDEIKFFICDDLGGPILFENHGANTLCGNTWEHVDDFLRGKGIQIPEERKPCTLCDGHRCKIGCRKYQ